MALFHSPQTKQSNLLDGTIMYNAPEQFQNITLSVDGLKRMDIWSVGMIMFTIMNPDQKGPWVHELDTEYTGNVYFVSYIEQLMKEGRKPVLCNTNSVIFGVWKST